MKLCRFGDNRLGIVDVDAGVIRDVTGALKVLPKVAGYPLPQHDLLIANLAKVRAEAQRLEKRAKTVPLSRAKLLAPVANPGKIIGAPVNYKDHIEEAKHDAQIAHGRVMEEAAIAKWGLFLKAGSALVGPSAGVKLRRPHTTIENRDDHEVELVAIIGKRGSKIKRADALKHVAGYAIGLDMTVRGPQFPDFRKSIDTYAVLGPWMVTADEFGKPEGKRLTIKVNGDIKQDSNTSLLIYDVPQLIEFASAFYTLEPGDLIYTGTPAGVSPITEGDVMVSEIDGIGTMTIKINGKASGKSTSKSTSKNKKAR